MPLILGPDGARLSKRHGAIGVRALRDRGVPPERVVAILASTVGLCAPEASVLPRDLVSSFDFARLPRTPTTIDPAAR